MRIRKLAVLGLVGAGVYVLVTRGRDHPVSMHEHDWRDFEEGSTLRRYRSAGHVLHHARELAGLSAATAEVYLLRALTPAFREQIMIVTAMANDCSP